MRFVCDFDGIAYPFVTALSRSEQAKGLSIENCHTWLTPLDYFADADEVRRHFDIALSYETMREVGLYPDFAPAMVALRDAGVQAEIMTHRSAAQVADARRLLADYGLDWLAVARATPEEKISYCLDEDIRVLVDDSPETIAKAHAAGLMALSLRFPYNSEVIERLGVVNAPDWDTLRALLLDSLAQSYA